MKKYLLLVLIAFNHTILHAQKTYSDSLKDFQDNYVKTHGAVKQAERSDIHFFPIDKQYCVTARFEKIEEAPWFKMETSGKEKQIHRVYGILHFKLRDTTLKLEVYQSQKLMGTKEYADLLFVPFTDLTNGEESYENGRYIDLTLDDVKTGYYLLDFNKAYNPYCAYISNTYNCPIPPKANNLTVAVRAGEMKFAKGH